MGWMSRVAAVQGRGRVSGQSRLLATILFKQIACIFFVCARGGSLSEWTSELMCVLYFIA